MSCETALVSFPLLFGHLFHFGIFFFLLTFFLFLFLFEFRQLPC